MYRGKGRISNNSEAVLFNMPSLEDDRDPKRRGEVIRGLEEIQRQGYEEGFASGERAGFEEGKQKASVLIDRLEKIIEDAASFKVNLVQELEARVVDLAIAVARKIIVEEISMRPEIIATVVKEALGKLQRMGRITIMINPALHDLFMEKKKELTDIHEDIMFDINSNISLTGPLVISELEEVVTDIDSLVANIIEEIKTVRPQNARPGLI